MLAATPSTDLPERTFIDLSGAHLGAERRAVTGECPAGIRAYAEIQDRCDAPVWVNQVDSESWILEGGGLRPTSRPVRRVLANGTDCSVAPGCEVVLFDGTGAPAIAAVPLRFRGPSGPSRPMTVDVAPKDLLRDGDVVTIHGEYLLANANYTFLQCAAGKACASSGAPYLSVRTAPDGTISAEIHVSAKVTTATGDVVDCRQAACELQTFYGGIPPVPLRFAPS
jgi:hypothetical protein